ncbi:MAG: hypothetical protein H0V34_11470 [Gammaproteobacteria bacterium]|nr:hypothetical protein [Gammaproteobacteria bacterium]
MEPEQIAISILTIAMSGVVSGVVTFRLNAKRDSRQLRRQKLESLFQAFNGYVTQLGSHWIPHMAVMAGKIDYNAALDMTAKGATVEPRHFETLEMLVAIYFPELQGHLDRLLTLRKRANDILEQHKSVCRESGPHDGSRSLSMMRAASTELDKLEEDFRVAIRAEAAKLNREV